MGRFGGNQGVELDGRVALRVRPDVSATERQARSAGEGSRPRIATPWVVAAVGAAIGGALLATALLFF